METDRHGLEVLPRSECLALLATSRVGRVVVTDRALPAAFPVNFVLLDDDIVFLTMSGSKLSAAQGEEVVAFEVDDIDPVHQIGWSVLVQGLARVIEDPGELARARALPLQPWAPGNDYRFVRIRSEIVSGRRLLPSASRARPTTGDLTVDPRAFAVCPSCGSRELLAVTDGFTRNFLCAKCAACWHVDQDALRRVRPSSCAGCSFRPACTAATARDDLLAWVDAGGPR